MIKNLNRRTNDKELDTTRQTVTTKKDVNELFESAEKNASKVEADVKSFIDSLFD